MKSSSFGNFKHVCFLPTTGGSTIPLLSSKKEGKSKYQNIMLLKPDELWNALSITHFVTWKRMAELTWSLYFDAWIVVHMKLWESLTSCSENILFYGWWITHLSKQATLFLYQTHTSFLLQRPLPYILMQPLSPYQFWNTFFCLAGYLLVAEMS